MGPTRAGLRREAQPEGAPSLLEPAERLAGDPMVATPLQVPADRAGGNRCLPSARAPSRSAKCMNILLPQLCRRADPADCSRTVAAVAALAWARRRPLQTRRAVIGRHRVTGNLPQRSIPAIYQVSSYSEPRRPTSGTSFALGAASCFFSSRVYPRTPERQRHRSLGRMTAGQYLRPDYFHHGCL
jgi:hypothetical protein